MRSALWLLVILLSPSGCTTKLSKADAVFLVDQPTFRLVHAWAPPFSVTTSSRSIKSPRMDGDRWMVAIPLAFMMGSGDNVIARLERRDGPLRTQERFAEQLRDVLPNTTILSQENGIYAPDFPGDISRAVKTGMTLSFNVIGWGMTIWPEYSLSMSPPTQIHSYLAHLVTVAHLAYPKTGQTLWESRCRVQTYGDSPEFSISALLQEANSHVDAVIRDLMEKCANELWEKFSTELTPLLPKHETSAMHGYAKAL